MSKCEWQYHNNPEWRAKKLARNTQYNRDNPEKSRAYQKNWYDRGGKTVRDAWRKANRDRYNGLIRAWRTANYDPAQNAAAGNRRRAMLKAGGTFTKDEWLDLCARYDYKCASCGKEEQTVDHIIPLSVGGLNIIDNIQPLCKSCNCSKGAKTIDYRQPQKSSFGKSSS
jgi:5-methylcytosine-specific restriction endonuclease McrA